MREGIFARMVGRALPPHVTDPNQKRIAAEAAENAIRQTAWFAGIVGVILLAVAGGMLYRHLPIRPSSPGVSEPSRAASELRGEVAKLRQENEDLQQKLDDMTQEFQGKVIALEGQVADLTTKLHAAEDSTAGEPAQPSAVQETPLSLRQVIGSAGTRATARSTGPYQCGDGRSARDPSGCRNTATPATPEVRRAAPGVYQCGDGRTARDPSGCMNTATPSGG
ncbi:MAG TPA: hypothetical protein VLT62_01155 [Candidatus Methylomirabilis sp.]|nr:hypothetical protein [Candidatus Methylomirabilis sp.]